MPSKYTLPFCREDEHRQLKRLRRAPFNYS